MAQIGRDALKAYFNTGDVPTEAQFIDLIDSLLNLSEDDSDDLSEGAVNLLLTVAERAAIALNNTHRASDGSDHSKVTANETAIGLNTTHRSSDGSDHSKVTANETAIGLNTTHRSSDGKDHSDVVLNNTHRSSDGSDHSKVTANETAIGLNTTHRSSDGKDHSDVVLNNTHRASDGSDHSKVTANETAIALKADAVSITGSHTETTTAIDFSSVQGYTITLTANRSYTISGLSSSNPTGILAITHAGYTPSFSTIEEADTLVNKNGVYYIKFTRQASGNIIQTNQLIGTSLTTIQSTLINDQIAGKPNAVALSITGTETVGQTLTANYTYADLIGNAESTSTFQWYRSDDASGTNDASIGSATSSTYTLVSADEDKYIRCEITPTNATATGSAYTTDYSGQIAGITYLINDNFLTMQPWTDPTLPDGWLEIGTPDANTFVDEVAAGMRFKTTSQDYVVRKLGLSLSTVYNFELVIDSVTSGGCYLLGATTPSANFTTPGTKTGTINSGSWDHLRIRRASASDCDLVITSVKIWA
jgi:hypothetical protein